MSVIVRNNSIYLTGSVGPIEDDWFNVSDVIEAVGQFEDNQPLTVYINCIGGWASDGVAIYGVLSGHRGGVDTVVDGIAASAGSVIAMAGKKISITTGSTIMIHDAWATTFGNAEDHERGLRGLDTLSNAIARIYAGRSGKTVAQCRELMKAETWYDGPGAVAAGFADAVLDRRAKPVMAFNYALFERAPEKLVALAKTKNWGGPASEREVPPNPRKETSMSKDGSSTATARAEATARIKAILTSNEADGRGEMAQHLAYDTDMEPEVAIKVLAMAPKGTKEVVRVASYEDRRVAAAALAMPGRPAESGSGNGRVVDIVASMKSRHGVK